MTKHSSVGLVTVI